MNGRFYYILLFSIILSVPVWGQDSLKAAAEDSSAKNVKKQKFIDLNGDGINDYRDNKGNTDKFIDKDGDGINDGEESALGLKKVFKYRKSGKRKKRF